MSPTRPSLLRCLPLLLWCGAVWYLSAQSDPQAAVGFSLDLPDWAEHAIEYAVGGLLARHAFAPLGSVRATLATVAFCLLWALVDEWHQSFVPGREPDLHDVLADMVGTSLGVLVHVAWTRRRTPVPTTS